MGNILLLGFYKNKWANCRTLLKTRLSMRPHFSGHIFHKMSFTVKDLSIRKLKPKYLLNAH